VIAYAECRSAIARASKAGRIDAAAAVRSLDQVWGGAAAASLNVVDRYISYLRRKLGEPQLIQTVRGVGFMLER